MRRWSYRLIVLCALATLVALASLRVHPPSIEASRASVADDLMLGFTVSPTQASYLGMPWDRTMDAAMSLQPEVVRIGAYWRQIERRPGQYDFRSLDQVLERASTGGQKVVLTVGMKAPRWPEYYLPRWLERDRPMAKRATVSSDTELRARTLAFVRQVVERYRDSETIAYWQVENEPLDHSGPQGWRIGLDLLREEVALVRELDHQARPVILTMLTQTHPLAALPPFRGMAEQQARDILALADIIGLDVYPSLGIRLFGRDLYFDFTGWRWESLAVHLQELARSYGKPAWVMEAQAEPWEPGKVAHTDASESRSVGPDQAAGVFQRLREAGFENILFWGVEHWYMRLERHSDPSWWDTLGAYFGPA